MKLYKIVVVPTAIYGNQTWIQTAEMKFFCLIAEYTHVDHQHNIENRKK